MSAEDASLVAAIAPTATASLLQTPTYFPSNVPSSTPSVDAFYFKEGTLVTQLYINDERSMDDIEEELFVG